MSEEQSTVQQDTSHADEAAPRQDQADAQPSQGERLVPVSESIRYRKRAQVAEQQLADTKGHLQDTQAELEQVRQTMDKLERRQHIDALLADADAVDLEVARLLTEMAVEMMDEPDVKLAIEDLRRHKPYLFRQRLVGASAMPARGHDTADHQSQQAAEQAAVSGDRRDLLRYLRLRRKA